MLSAKDIANARTHESQHDTGTVSADPGYFVWVGQGDTGSLDVDSERPAFEAGYLSQIAVRLASGSRALTFDLVVAGSVAVSVSATVTTTWQTLVFRRALGRYEIDDLLAIGFSGATAGVDRIILQAEWRR